MRSFYTNYCSTYLMRRPCDGFDCCRVFTILLLRRQIGQVPYQQLIIITTWCQVLMVWRPLQSTHLLLRETMQFNWFNYLQSNPCKPCKSGRSSGFCESFMCILWAYDKGFCIHPHMYIPLHGQHRSQEKNMTEVIYHENVVYEASAMDFLLLHVAMDLTARGNQYNHAHCILIGSQSALSRR